MPCMSWVLDYQKRNEIGTLNHKSRRIHGDENFSYCDFIEFLQSGSGLYGKTESNQAIRHDV